MSNPEKIVFIGDMLTVDILFGNLNGMTTIYVNKFKDYFSDEKFKVEGFKEDMPKSITRNGYNEVYMLEAL